jgi:hypothetical protein
MANSSPVVSACIIAHSEESEAIFSNDSGSDPVLNCCNLFANGAGDWNVGAAPRAGQNNFFTNPNLCSPGEEDFGIAADSPCTPSGNDCGVLIGAVGISCNAAD